MNTEQAKLLAWINTHDCGVSPCGVPNDDGSITVCVSCRHEDGKRTVDETVVHTYQEARVALGY